MDENQRVLERGFHLFRIGDEVRREITAVELHSFDRLQRRLEALCLFDRDDAVLADLFHRLGDQIADLLVVVGGDRTNLRDLFLPLGRDAHLLEVFDDGGNRGINAALERHRVDAGGDVLEAFAENRLCQYGGGGSTVTRQVAGLGCDFFHHLRAHVLERIGELDFLGDGYSVLGDGRRTELLVDDDVPSLGAKRDLDRLRELIDAALESRARIGVEV